MKEMKSLKSIIYLLIGVLLISYTNTKAQNPIVGPVSIVPGESTQYTWSNFGYNNPNWSAPYASFSPGSSNVYNPYITISKTITSPTVEIKVISHDVSTPTVTLTDYRTILVDPFLVGATSVHPGGSITITNQDNREGYAGHNACLWNWSCDNMNALFCGNGNCNNSIINTAVFTCPTTLPASVISSGLYSISCTKSCGLGSFSYPSQMNVRVVLNDPVISGTQDISCVTSLSNLVYTASQVSGATYYIWEVPTGWQIMSGDHTNSIAVATFGYGPGDIKVTAYAANGSPIKSNKVSYTIGCCPQNLTIATNVTSGNIDKRQADNSITCTSVINNGGNAKYHAGSFVHLSPGFSAEQNADLHAYIQFCTGTYFKMNSSNSNDNSKTDKENTVDIINLSDRPIEDRIDFNIYPNPNNGNFKLTLNNNAELPESISIKDILGKEVKVINEPTKYEYDFEMKEFDQGLYIINVYYSDKTISKKVIKN